MSPFPAEMLKGDKKPRLALSLRLLAQAVDDTWPGRATFADGWLGDAAHRARVSDHNPDEFGIVRALDVTCKGIRPRELVTAALNHPSTAYVIWSRRIWSVSHDFIARTYDGPDPHLSHVHISIRSGDEASSSRWRWYFA